MLLVALKLSHHVTIDKHTGVYLTWQLQKVCVCTPPAAHTLHTPRWPTPPTATAPRHSIPPLAPGGHHTLLPILWETLDLVCFLWWEKHNGIKRRISFNLRPYDTLLRRLYTLPLNGLSHTLLSFLLPTTLCKNDNAVWLRVVVIMVCSHGVSTESRCNKSAAELLRPYFGLLLLYLFLVPLPLCSPFRLVGIMDWTLFNHCFWCHFGDSTFKVKLID